MTITIPTFITKEQVVRPDLLAETPDPRTDVTAAEWNALHTLATAAAEAINSGGVDLTPIEVANAATVAISIRTTDDATTKLLVGALGLGGATDIYVVPDVPADPGDPGHGVHIAGGVGGATDQDGGVLELDAGAPNGAGVDGNVKIGRNAATEILIGKEGVGSDITLEGQVTTVGHTPSVAADVATKGYVDQPAGRTVSGTTDNLTAADIGGVVFYSQAGGVEAELPDLSGSLISGKALILTLQGTNAATVITVDPGSGVTIDGSSSSLVAEAGKARVSLISLDGLAWYSGTP